MGEQQSKTSHIQLRVSEAEKASIMASAKLAGMEMSPWILSTIFSKPQSQFHQLVAKLASCTNEQEAAYVFASLNDFMSGLDASQLEEAVKMAPEKPFSALNANYLAAQIEMACQIKQCVPPLWLNRIQPLEKPYFASDLISLRLHLLTASPAPFRKRNLFIDTSMGGRR